MLLSVIIPVYNNVDALAQCLESFRGGQSQLADVEFIFVDDGSEVPVELPVAPRTKVVRIAHAGAGAARNAGIDKACGSYVWFFDADDRVEPMAFHSLLLELRSGAASCDVVHTGGMIVCDTPCGETPYCRPSRTSVAVPVAELFRPRTSYLDHTTYLVRRSLLVGNPQLRYPSMSLLEDSLFVLHLLDSVRYVHSFPDIRPYIRQTFRPSSTSGAWSDARASRFVPDICTFFEHFSSFLVSHPEIGAGADCFCRMRYVYLRVLVVKGCSWRLVEEYVSAVYDAGFAAPVSVKEKLLRSRLVGKSLAFLCRILKKKR